MYQVSRVPDLTVVPAKAGTHGVRGPSDPWIPAFAGMTVCRPDSRFPALGLRLVGRQVARVPSVSIDQAAAEHDRVGRLDPGRGTEIVDFAAEDVAHFEMGAQPADRLTL